MAIQINLARTATPTKTAYPTAYVRITMTNFDWNAKSVTFGASVWADKQSRDEDAQQVMGLPSITIRKDAQPAQFRVLTDPVTGQPVLDEDNNAKTVQVTSALPSFEEFEQLVGAAVAQGQDYRKVGYDLYKDVEIVKSNSPQDV